MSRFEGQCFYGTKNHITQRPQLLNLRDQVGINGNKFRQPPCSAFFMMTMPSFQSPSHQARGWPFVIHSTGKLRHVLYLQLLKVWRSVTLLGYSICCVPSVQLSASVLPWTHSSHKVTCGEYPFFRIIDITQEKGLCSESVKECEKKLCR